MLLQFNRDLTLYTQKMPACERGACVYLLMGFWATIFQVTPQVITQFLLMLDRISWSTRLVIIRVESLGLLALNFIILDGNDNVFKILVLNKDVISFGTVYLQLECVSITLIVNNFQRINLSFWLSTSYRIGLIVLTCQYLSLAFCNFAMTVCIR